MNDPEKGTNFTELRFLGVDGHFANPELVFFNKVIFVFFFILILALERWVRQVSFIWLIIKFSLLQDQMEKKQVPYGNSSGKEKLLMKLATGF